MDKPAANPQSQQPIGVFDSGVGGLSVLRRIRALLPAESLHYVADSRHLPYGDKTVEQVRQRVFRIAGRLIDQGAKALVVACNTATAAAIHELREAYPLPIIGMEPGVKPAVESSRSGVVGILATQGTLQSDKFTRLVSRFGTGAEVIVQPCPGLVERIEQGRLDDAETETLLQRYLQPLREKGADALVLGCTHYPFVRPLIERLAGPGVQVIDTGWAVARQVQRQLDSADLLNKGGNSEVRFFTTGTPEQQSTLFQRLWGEAMAVRALPEEPVLRVLHHG